MEYQIVWAVDPSELVRKVRELLVQGWVPAGGVAVDVRHQWAQAMIRRM